MNYDYLNFLHAKVISIKKTLEISKIAVFYLIMCLLVLFSPFGAIITYVIITGLALLFTFGSGIRIRPGKPAVGLIAGTLSMCVIFLIIVAAGGASIRQVSADAAGIMILGAVFQAIVACGEELSFRQYLFAGLDLICGRRGAALLSSAAFAALHLPSMLLLGATPAECLLALTTIFIASLALTLLYVKAGILAAAGFHFAWNFFQYSVFGFTGPDAALALTKTGSKLLTGGSFGPEASLTGAVVITAVLGSLWWYYERKESKEAVKHK